MNNTVNDRPAEREPDEDDLDRAFAKEMEDPDFRAVWERREAERAARERDYKPVTADVTRAMRHGLDPALDDCGCPVCRPTLGRTASSNPDGSFTRLDILTSQLRHLDQADLAALATSIRDLQDADAVANEYEPAPMLRSELTRLLDLRRDNNVYVYVPVEGQLPVRLDIATVYYRNVADHIAIRTVPWFIEPDGPAWTPWLTLPARAVEGILIDHSGVHLQVRDAKDETTGHEVMDGHCGNEGCVGGARCVLLLSNAWQVGAVHLAPAELVTVRIEVAR